MKYSKKTGCFYPDDIGYDDLPDDIFEVDQEEFERAMSRQVGETFDVVSGAVRIIAAQPSAAHELVDGEWVFDARKQALIDVEVERLRREAWGTALDALMVEAVSIAQPLDYAASRKRLPADKAARLAAWNAYIDELAGLEYSEQAVWPVRPLV